ncbi:MAG TPA: prepilin-type N-terminal cleavage/methylation domain-containing protein, partial [Victivallales bacterium]|nr:prepilin-type N-terminal cleavage/methylation domain-containing protein [Victivallales bacterium]
MNNNSNLRDPRENLKYNEKKFLLFTLIELLIVIAVIAILIAILMPALSGAKERAYQIICASNQKQVWLALHNYASDNDSWGPVYVWSNIPPYNARKWFQPVPNTPITGTWEYTYPKKEWTNAAIKSSIYTCPRDAIRIGVYPSGYESGGLSSPWGFGRIFALNARLNGLDSSPSSFDKAPNYKKIRRPDQTLQIYEYHTTSFPWVWRYWGHLPDNII